MEIKQNPGILPFQQGQAFLQRDQWSIIKTIDLKGFERDILFNIEKYSELNDITTHYSNNSFYQFEIQELQQLVQYLRDETIEKFQQLSPSRKVKRGLINPIGSIIKIITGNLDYDDAVKYDKLIANIQTHEQEVSNKVTIISKMLDHFLNSTKTIDENTQLMNERLIRIETKLSDLSVKENQLSYVTYLISILNMFVANFRTMYIKLSEIETALALSKVSVIHKSILNPNELLNLLLEIAQHDNLMFTVNEQNLINLEETFSVKTYITNNVIRFIIDIPLVDNVTYNYFKLYSLPIFYNSINLTYIIIPDFPYLLVEGLKYLPIAKPCKEVTDKDYLCTEDDLTPYADKTCIEQLMTYCPNPSSCFPRSVDMEDLKLQKITANSWILFSKINKIISQNCDSNIIHGQIQGTYILTIPDRCIVSIEGIEIRGHRYYSMFKKNKSLPVITLPSLPENQQQNSTDYEPVNLKKVNLDDIQHLNYVLQKGVKNVKSVSVQQSESVATIVLYVIVSVLIVIFIVLKYKIILRKLCKKTPSDVNNPQTSPNQVNEIPLIHLKK